MGVGGVEVESLGRGVRSDGGAWVEGVNSCGASTKSSLSDPSSELRPPSSSYAGLHWWEHTVPTPSI